MYHQRILPAIRARRLLHEASLELGYQCNLRCFHCYNPARRAGHPLSWDQYQDLLGDLAAMQCLFLLLTGGEPLLHPLFPRIGALARDLGFVTRIRSNGTLIDADMAARLRDQVDPWLVELSLHGATARAHERMTGVPGSFSRLLAGLEHAMRAGLRCTLVVTPTAWNQDQLGPMLDLGRDLGVEVRFQGPLAPRDDGDPAPLAVRPPARVWAWIARHGAAALEDRVPEDEPAPPAEPCGNGPGHEDPVCGVGRCGVDIDPFGRVRPCMHWPEVAGSLHRQGLAAIWKDSPVFARAARQARQTVRRWRDRLPPGMPCCPATLLNPAWRT